MVSKKNSGFGSGATGAFSHAGGGCSALARKQSVCYKNRKECILKKTMEISALCDIEACAIVCSPDGKVDTWPEDQDDVLKIVKKYQDWLQNNKKMVLFNGFDGDMNATTLLNDQELRPDTDVLDIGYSLGDIMNHFVATHGLWKEIKGNEDEKQGLDFLLDSITIESLKELKEIIESKLKAVSERLGIYQQSNSTQSSPFPSETLEDFNFEDGMFDESNFCFEGGYVEDIENFVSFLEKEGTETLTLTLTLETLETEEFEKFWEG